MDKTAPSTRHTSEQVRRSLTVFHVRCRKNCANPPGQSIRSATSTTKITRKAISIESRPVAHAEQHQAATAAPPFPCTRPTDPSTRTQCESQCGRHGGCPQRQGDGVEHDHHRNRRFEGPMLCHTLVSSPPLRSLSLRLQPRVAQGVEVCMFRTSCVPQITSYLAKPRYPTRNQLHRLRAAQEAGEPQS